MERVLVINVYQFLEKVEEEKGYLSVCVTQKSKITETLSTFNNSYDVSVFFFT